MIKLNAYYDKKSSKGQVFYNPVEKGFDTIPDVKSDITLLISYVNIGFDSDDMCSNQIFGLSPAYSWIRQKLLVPENFTRCALKLNEDFDYGTWRLDRGNEWKTYYDSDSGWICIGNPIKKGQTININFLDNAIAVLNLQGELQSLWMKPLISENITLTI